MQKINTDFLHWLERLVGVVIDSLTAEELKCLAFCIFVDLRILLPNSVLQRHLDLAFYQVIPVGKNKGFRVCVSFSFSCSKAE